MSKKSSTGKKKTGTAAKMTEAMEKMADLSEDVSKMVMNNVDPKIEKLAEAELLKRAKANIARIQAGIYDHPEFDFGDGDQSPLHGQEAAVMTAMWGQGADYSPLMNPMLSQWCKDCYNGDPEKIMGHLDRHGRRILDKRESVIRMAGLFHVIAGARSFSSQVPDEARVQLTSKTDFQGSLKLLIKAGANVNAKDVAGYTPMHHCTSAVGNDTTLDLARILVEAGASVNLPNRSGSTPLFEPTIAAKYNMIKFLFKNGADVNVTENTGTSLMKLASYQPKVMKLYSEHLSKISSSEKDKLKEEGNYKACNSCKKDSNCKRCIACNNVWYCGKECQKKDWKEHKIVCKKITDGYMEVKFAQKFTTMYNLAKGASKGCSGASTAKDAKKIQFTVKIQVALGTPNADMMVYNKDRSFQGCIEPTEAIHKPLSKTIATKGVAGAKGYFRAIIKDEKITINPYEVQIPEAW